MEELHMTTLMRGSCCVIAGCALLWAAGCGHHESKPEMPADVPDARTPIHLPAEADRQHREVMMMHLETVQVLTGALAEGDYDLAKGVMEAHLGFFARRHVAIREKMETIPAEYRALAGAHVEAVKELTAIIPSKDLKQILPRVNAMLKTCMACHLEFRSEGTGSR
jgi:hypothetical protein